MSEESTLSTNSDEQTHVTYSDIGGGWLKTLSLLKIDALDGPIYFVVQGIYELCSAEELEAGKKHFYEEHTCPINFCQVEMISHNGNHDPHGLFKHVRTIWMPKNYEKAQQANPYEESQDEILENLFPELRAVTRTLRLPPLVSFL